MRDYEKTNTLQGRARDILYDAYSIGYTDGVETNCDCFPEDIVRAINEGADKNIFSADDYMLILEALYQAVNQTQDGDMIKATEAKVGKNELMYIFKRFDYEAIRKLNRRN